MLAGPGSGDSPVKWEVRKEVEQVSTLYATYSFDPKTASDEPRAILADSDLIKISIADSGRDKRTGVLIRGASNDDVIGDDDTDDTLGKLIRDDLTEEGLDFSVNADDDIEFNLEIADDDGIQIFRATSQTSIIGASGNATLNFSRSADTWKFEPMDVNGAIRFYGCATSDSDCTDSGDTLEFLGGIKVDEDAAQGNNGGDTAPWLAVNSSVPDGTNLVILAVYYESSEAENLIGGQEYCDGFDVVTDVCPDAATVNDGDDNPVFTSDEVEDNTALMVRAKSDGDEQFVNLYLTETGLFTGRYEGYLRLTDANGDGQDSAANPPITTRDDWGYEVKTVAAQ